MINKLLVLGALLGGALSASPIQITITLSGGQFDSGLTTVNVDTGATFTTASATCTGTGCTAFPSLAALNGDTFAFTVPSGSINGSGSILTGTLLANLSSFTFGGESAFTANSTITENVSAAGILADLGSFTGTMVLNWSGNSTIQTRAATGTITLMGDVATIPEPSSVLMLLAPLAGLVAMRFRSNPIVK